jgi:hypothetical protein
VQQQLHPCNQESEETMNTSVPMTWTDFTKLRAEANRLNKIVVFDALSQASIIHVCVGFDGEGDDGQMVRASAQADGKTVEFPPVKLTIQIAQSRSAQLTGRVMSLQDAIEQLCYEYLEQKHRGWEINEGSVGEFTFDVAARTITLDFNGRIIDYEHSIHTF